MPTDDPILDILESEFVLQQGRPQHRPTYDTGRKQVDGTPLDLLPGGAESTGQTGAPTNRLVYECVDGRWQARFEEGG